MFEQSKRKIMVVNDDEELCVSMARSLDANEYEVSTATGGYNARWQLKHTLVDLIISDLQIPEMPGREFISLIRRRFPEILLIATDETDDGDAEPSSPEAHALCARVQHQPGRLLSTVDELLRTSAIRRRAYLLDTAITYVVGDQNDTVRMQNILLTCTECQQLFPVVALKVSSSIEVSTVPCFFCGNKLRYIIDPLQFVTSSCRVGSQKRRYHPDFRQLYDSATTFIRPTQRRLWEFCLQVANGRTACKSPMPRNAQHSVDREDAKGVEVGDSTRSPNLRGTR